MSHKLKKTGLDKKMTKETKNIEKHKQTNKQTNKQKKKQNSVANKLVCLAKILLAQQKNLFLRGKNFISVAKKSFLRSKKNHLSNMNPHGHRTVITLKCCTNLE